MYTKISTYLFSALILLFGISLDAKAQNKIWTGAIDSSWHTAGNWNPTGVPTSSHNVLIRGNTTPRPVITSNVTIENLTINQYTSNPGDQLTIRNNATVTINGSLTIPGNGVLNIVNGYVNMTGANSTTFTLGYSNIVAIKITNGSFTAGNVSKAIDVTLNANVSLGNGTFDVSGNLTVSNSKVFNVQNGTVNVDKITTLNGTYNGDDGTTTFNGKVDIKSGGLLNLDSGSIDFNDEVYIGNSGTANFGSGTVNINSDLEVVSGGYLNIQDANVTINGDANFNNSGHMTLDNGVLHVGGDVNFSWSGTIDAGNSTIILEGDISSPTGSTFDAGTSTVVFAGDNQNIDIGSDVTFYNVEIEPGTTVDTGVNGNTIVIENDLTIGEDGELNVNGSDNVNIRGDVNGDEDAYSPTNPYAVTAIAPNTTTLVITFNMEMDQSTTETTGNYSIYKKSNPSSTVAISNASLNTGGNKKVVTITMATIEEDVIYAVLIRTNIKSSTNANISANHIKYFQKKGPLFLYSRQTGNWSDNSTWSKISHTGAAASENPTTTSNATIIVGNGHTVSINGAASITNQSSLEVKTSSKLQVVSGGTLTLGTKTITGIGTFEVTNGTLAIGSSAGISSSGATGNIQTTTRTFGSSGSYTYNGSGAQNTGTGLPSTANNFTVNNAAGVTLSSNLKVNGTLYLTSGSLIVNSGYNLIANTKSVSAGKLAMKRSITGSRGWRLFSSPIASTYGDLLDGIVTQGYTGSSLGNAPLDSLQPNVMYYLESHPGTDNQRWRAPVSAATSLTPAQGLYTYVFGNIPADSRYNDNLPATLTVEGQEHSGAIDFNVTYTTAADSGWSLLGNPYAATINWDDNSNWTKTNIDNTIYLWDYSTNQYKTWNGTTGDLGNGLISPFQGFWVKANAASPSLIVQEDAKTTGGVFVGKAMASENDSKPSFSLTLSDDDNTAATHFMFSEEGKNGKDRKDAFRLVPLPDIHSYLDLASITQDGDRLSINNLPRKFGIPIEVPLFVNAYEIGAPKKKALHFIFDNFKNIPQGWTITLVDTKTGEQINIEEFDTYLLEIETTSAEDAPNGAFGAKPKITHKAKAASSRFLIRIEPGEDAADLPNKFELKQNFPNPFNPTTNIRFTLPLQSYTTLTIYDILGREITTLVSKELDAGEYTFKWDSGNLASGVYLYRLVNKNGVFTKKMTLIK
ncbi:MAG: T9SS type A sorting domain-containing protein [Balneolaceae bacterium]